MVKYIDHEILIVAINFLIYNSTLTTLIPEGKISWLL